MPVGTALSDQYYFVVAISDAMCGEPVLLSQSTASGSQDHYFIQLPKIDLPKYDGNLIKWSSFCDTFVSLVHGNRNVGNLERFHYLIICLSGSPLTVVKSIPLSADNYVIAWEALIERYDNQQLLATAHLEKLFAFRPINSESPSSLLAFVTVFQENIVAIKAHGVHIIFYRLPCFRSRHAPPLRESCFSDHGTNL